MIPTMWLIAERDSDPKVMKRILEEKRININVKAIRPSGGGGLPRLDEELTVLLNSVIRKKKPGDCIVVLHDADRIQHHPMHYKHREHYKNINRVCRSDEFKDQVTLLIAHDELEAWLLADEKLCKWLGVKPYSDCESIVEPSKELDRLIRNHNAKMGWTGRFLDDVLKHIDASGDKLSKSMHDSIQEIKQLPCAQT